MDKHLAMKWLYASIATIPIGALLGFLSGGLGLAVMVLGWIGVLYFDGPAHGKANFGKTLTPSE